MAENGGDGPVKSSQSEHTAPPGLQPRWKLFRRFYESIRDHCHLRAISNLLKSVLNDRGRPYVAIHEAKVSTLLADPKASRYKGLLFCHRVTHDAIHYWISYWQSEDDFKDYGSLFIADNAGANAPPVSGAFSHYYRKADHWWVIFQFLKLIIPVAALVGAFVGLWEQGYKLLEPPNIDIALDADHPEHLLSTGRGSTPIKFSVTNRCRFATVSINVKAAFGPSEIKNNTDFKYETYFSRIEPGTTKEFFIRPELPKPENGPLSYQFRLSADATAGWFRTKSFDFENFPRMGIWGVIAMTSPTVNSAASQNGRCTEQGILYSGRAQSGTIQFKVSYPKRAVESVVISVPLDHNIVPSVGPYVGKSAHGIVVVQRLEMRALEQFKQYDYTVQVAVPGVDSSECQQVQLEYHIFEGAKK
jgi:hypothetical protein